MSTPNPLIPQGTFQAQAGKGASNVRIAVATIVAIHVVFFGGLLLQGCKRDTKLGSNGSETNSTSSSNLSLPPIASDSLYYSNATRLPSDAVVAAQTNTQAMTTATENTLAPSTANAARDLWKVNLGANGTGVAQDQTGGATTEYTVVRGDTLGKIASANGTTLMAVRKANPNVDPSKLRPGMKLQIPAATVPGGAAAQLGSTGTIEAGGAATASDTYTVKAGDTLTKVAKSHGVTVSQLRAANNLKTSGLKVGQKLKIPSPSAAGAPDTNAIKHTKSGLKISPNSAVH